MKIAEMLMNKSNDMCYELHTAPEARVDSYLHEHAALAPASGGEACGRTILEKTASDVRYIETLCARHTAIDAAVLEQLRAVQQLPAADQPEALAQLWQTAQKLWRVELDAGVNDRYREASRDDKPVIAADRTTFGNWLRAREELLRLLYPDDETAVREVIARTIMERAVTACADAAQVQFTGR